MFGRHWYPVDIVLMWLNRCEIHINKWIWGFVMPPNSHHKRTRLKLQPLCMFANHRLNLIVSMWRRIRYTSSVACDVPIGLQLILTTNRTKQWTPHRAEGNFTYDQVGVPQLLVFQGILYSRRRKLRPNPTTRSPGFHSSYRSSSPYRSAPIPLSPWRCIRRTRLRSSQLPSAQLESPSSWRRHSSHTQNAAHRKMQQGSTDIANARFLECESGIIAGCCRDDEFPAYGAIHGEDTGRARRGPRGRRGM